MAGIAAAAKAAKAAGAIKKVKAVSTIKPQGVKPMDVNSETPEIKKVNVDTGKRKKKLKKKIKDLRDGNTKSDGIGNTDTSSPDINEGFNNKMSGFNKWF